MAPTDPPGMPGVDMFNWLSALWPLHRTLNSDDTARALEMCGKFLDHPDYELHRFAPKSNVFTWWIPERYHVSEAWLEIDGERVADFAENPLHIVSYSLPQRIEGKLDDIRGHLHTRESQPDAIPWEFKYYERDWGFCLRHRDLARFDDGAPVKGVIDASFGDEDFLIGELFLPGETNSEALFLTNICHPMQVNDSLSGLVVAIEMARRLARMPNRRLGFRLLIVPEMIGTVAWFARNEAVAKNIEFAWFCEMVGHDNSFVLQRSRQGDAPIDRAFLMALAGHRRHGEERTGAFRDVVASDELVTNGPGFDIPTPSLTRWPYAEYHTSADNPDIVGPDNLAETLDVFMDLWTALDGNYYPRRTFKGPVMLSRYGLWVDWRDDPVLNAKTEKIMLLLEGDRSLIDIAHELALPFATVRDYLERFFEAGLIDKNELSWDAD